MKKPVEVSYTHIAEKELTKLPKQLARRIVFKVIENASQPDALARAKALTGRFAGAYRYRIGDYRAVFVLDDEGNIVVLTVLTIKHRKDIYK